MAAITDNELKKIDILMKLNKLCYEDLKILEDWVDCINMNKAYIAETSGKLKIKEVEDGSK